ncbi:MAG: membrane protein insertion efficiency factor YidD [Proteobacteria bacterium]|nr:membrane protein insertion efficiency factor YidD [Pseudomonadota bacterium]
MRGFLKGLVRFYQMFLAPFVYVLAGTRCRFYPSCSHYAIQCLDKHTFPMAITRISGRILKCGPWHPGGIDIP